MVLAIRRGDVDVARALLESGADLPPSKADGPTLRSDNAMQKLLAFHRDERRALATVQGLVAREAAASAAADALLAEEEAEKSLAEARQAKAKRKKHRQKSNQPRRCGARAGTDGRRMRRAGSIGRRPAEPVLGQPYAWCRCCCDGFGRRGGTEWCSGGRPAGGLAW